MPQDLAAFPDVEQLLVISLWSLLHEHGYRIDGSLAHRRNEAGEFALIKFAVDPVSANDYALYVDGGAFVRKQRPRLSDQLQAEVDQRVPSVGESQFYFTVMPPTGVGWDVIPGGDQRWRVSAQLDPTVLTGELLRVLRSSILPLLEALLDGERHVDVSAHECVRLKRQKQPFV